MAPAVNDQPHNHREDDIVEPRVKGQKTTAERMDDLCLEIREMIYEQLAIENGAEYIDLTELVVDVDTAIIHERAVVGPQKLLYQVGKNTYGNINPEITNNVGRLAEYISEEVRLCTYLFEHPDDLESFATFMRLICGITGLKLHFSVRLPVFKEFIHSEKEPWQSGCLGRGRFQYTDERVKRWVETVQLLPGTCDVQLFFHRTWYDYRDLYAITAPLRNCSKVRLTVQFAEEVWEGTRDDRSLAAMMIAAVHGIQLDMQTQMNRDRKVTLLTMGCRGVGGVKTFGGP